MPSEEQSIGPSPPPENGADSETSRKLFAHRYEILEEVGRGGMGVVYRARDKVLDRVVVVKRLDWNGSGESARRFQGEARAAGRIKHQNTVTVLDFGQTEDGDLYLVMEFVAGESLEQLISKDGSLPPDMVVDVFRLVLRGLQRAHECGIIHRDIKPSNIMLAENADGEMVPKLMDFGISRIKEEDQHLTQTGVGIGTPDYASPEQIRGQKVDERSDIYSVGCSMFEALTGKLPFPSQPGVGVALRRSLDPAPLMSDVSGTLFDSELEDIVSKCLAIDCEERFQSVEELRSSLKSYCQNSADYDEEDDLALKGTADVRKPSRLLSTLLVVSMVVGTGIGIGLLTLTHQHPKKPREKVAVKEASSDFSIISVINDADRSGSALPDIAIANASDLEDLSKDAKYVHINDEMVRSGAIKKLARYKPSVLDLRGTTLNKENLGDVSQIRSLIQLQLNRCKGVTDESIVAISALRHLDSLELDSTAIGDKGLASLASLKELELLNLNHCAVITDAGLEAIGQSSIKSLHLRSTKITDKGLALLARSGNPILKFINYLDLEDCRITDRGLESIAQMKGLLLLNLRGTKITDAGIERLSALKRLKRLDIGKTEVGDQGLLTLINVQKRLSFLGLRNTKVTARCMPRLFLEPSLKAIDLHGLRLGDRTIAGIDPRNLSAINVSGNDTTVDGIASWVAKTQQGSIIVVDQAQVRPLSGLVSGERAQWLTTDSTSKLCNIDTNDVDFGDGFRVNMWKI